MNERNRFVTIVLVLGFLAAGIHSVDAQTTDPKTPASSPLWWTLTDEVTPQELRRIYGDPEDSQRRYLLAVEKDLVEPVSRERLEELVFFNRGELSPELLPMWEGFDIFAGFFGYKHAWEERAPSRLREHGISEGGTQAILELSRRHNQEVASLTAEIRDDAAAFIDQQREAERVMGEAGLDRALEARDARAIAIATNRSIPETRRLMSKWEIDPRAAIAEKLLPELRKRLSSRDWQLFREYLLSDIAPGTSTRWFEE